MWPFCTHTAELSSTTLHFVFASAVMVILLVVIHLFMKGFQLCHESKSYICNWVNLLVNVFEVSLYVLSIMFVSVFGTPCMCPQSWQWQIGVVAILLAWINLIRLCAKFPSMGIYIIMFGNIVLTFLKVIILSVLLLSTFAITFYMVFSEPQFQVSHIQRSQPIVLVCIFTLYTVWMRNLLAVLFTAVYLSHFEHCHLAIVSNLSHLCTKHPKNCFWCVSSYYHAAMYGFCFL